MESIKGHPEHVETVFGEGIVARDESLVVLAGACGLGPPDLCWLQKAPKSALTGATGESKGYYHCCLGIDASSSAAVAAYFATLTSLVEPPTFLQGLFSTSEMRIERGFYCCYDPLTRLDVRCELCIPGGVVCGALDCEGNVHDVTPDLWRNCVVATFLRSELYDAELVSHSSVPVARYPPLPTPADESRLLAAVAGLYEDGVLPEALEALTVDQAGGAAPEHADVVLHTVLHYFAKRQRWGTALEFFVKLSVHYPTAAMYVAAVQRECGLYDDALATLSRAVDEVPDDPLLLAALATECLYSEQVEAALRFATKAAQLRPLLRAAWLALARAHVRLGAGTAALVVLNLVPPPPLPGKEEGMLHVVAPPEPKSVTKPAVPSYDLDVVSMRQVLSEEGLVHPPNSTGAVTVAGTATVPGSGVGGSGTATLAGALMVPREPPDAAPAPDTAPLRITKAVLAAVYTVLQELVAVSGWDGFLRLRSAVFVMHADSDLLREQQREAEEREKQLQLLHRQLSATLPSSPSWAQHQQVSLQPLASRRPQPEGVDLQSALDEAAVMGLAEYPEHIEDDYDDPRVIAAREAHRRHLREIAERQAKLEAAEGGAYADDEWDGSSSSSGGGGGGPRSATSRSRRSKSAKGRQGKRTHSLTAAAEGDPAAAAQQQQEPGVTEAAATYTGIVVAGEEAVRLATAVGPARELEGGLSGVVVASAIVQEAEQQQAEQRRPEGAEYDNVAAASLNTREDGGEAKRALVTGTGAAPAAAGTGGWWSSFFGSGVSQPQHREPGPLGEACELSMTSDDAAMVMGPLGLASLRTPRTLAVTGAGVAHGRQALSSPTVAAQALSVAAPAGGLLQQQEEEGSGLWWRPAHALGANAAVAAAAAMAAGAGAHAIVLCARLSPRYTGRASERPTGGAECRSQDGASSLLQGPLHKVSAVVGGEDGSGVCGGCPGGHTAHASSEACCSPIVANTSSPSARPGLGSPVALAKGLLGMLVCKFKSQASGYRWRQRQRRLQRALMLAAAPMPTPYGPLSPLLLAAAAAVRKAHPAATNRVPSAGRGGRVGLPIRRHKRRSGTDAGSGETAVAAAAAALSEVVRVSALPRLWLQPRVAARGGGIDVQRCGPGPVAEAEVGSGNEAAADPTAFADGTTADIVAGEAGATGAADDGFPLVLQNHDTDRQMVLEGLDATETGAKRLCARWLDELIVALWHDLQAFLDWKAIDSDLHDAGFRSHAEIVAGTAPGPTAADYQRATDAGGDANGPALPPPPKLPSLPALEWLRRGLLAERLHHEADALAAYQAAVMTPPPPPAGAGSAGALMGALPGWGPGAFSMIAWQAIMRLAPSADPRDAPWALRASQAVMAWLEAHIPTSSGATAVPFTSGVLLTANASALAAIGAAGPVSSSASAIAIRAAPAAATVAAGGGGRLQACPLPVVHCLHLIAAVLGDTGVEAALAAPGAAAPAKGGCGAAVHPVAATVLRQAVQAAMAVQGPASARPQAGVGAGDRVNGGGGGSGDGNGAGADPTAPPQAERPEPQGSVDGTMRG